ncbi:hypothetical protein A2Z33_00015 [Candidatus Gottesmanbacteria bacterium RBG_16_52_11]|uniref:Uncharacterized protein n=1 Tax=Candidatus Gottesmanbacteria bacterium RBG_16_52_11 TaxID=1798374 RepID=A0A1F5YN58_9BACT|nr:MAG: hypothetical protein A2Z33_00015 [Candidatus Gottesmanbacteria bacterium RBG_16_52_11]
MPAAGKPRKPHGLIYRLFVWVLLFFVGVGVGILLFANRERLPQLSQYWSGGIGVTDENISQRGPTDIPLPDISRDEPATDSGEWVRFKAPGLGFSFEHPATWEVLSTVPQEFQYDDGGFRKIMDPCPVMFWDSVGKAILIGFDGFTTDPEADGGVFCWSVGGWSQYPGDTSERAVAGIPGSIAVDKWYGFSGGDVSKTWNGDFVDTYKLPVTVKGYESLSAAVFYRSSDQAVARQVFDHLIGSVKAD